VQDRLHRMDQRLYPRTSRTAFALDFESTRFLIDSLSSDDPVRVIYHSHPDVGAYFSEEDRRFASRDREPTFPGVDYLVVDVRCRRVAGASLFRLVDGTFRDIHCYQGFP
jgi:proteasome lid subunit RPN8/RPN11